MLWFQRIARIDDPFTRLRQQQILDRKRGANEGRFAEGAAGYRGHIRAHPCAVAAWRAFFRPGRRQFESPISSSRRLLKPVGAAVRPRSAVTPATAMALGHSVLITDSGCEVLSKLKLEYSEWN